MVVDILNFLLDAIYYVYEWFAALVTSSGIFGLVVAVFIFFCLYRFIFAPVFGNLRSGSSDKAKKKDDV